MNDVEVQAPPAPQNPLLFAHRLLRGRYPIAIALAVALGPLGAFVGYSVVKPKYKSTGIVEVAPRLPRILYESEENQVPPMFDAFVAAQATYLDSARVRTRAVNNDDLRQAGWPGGAAGQSMLDQSLEVRHRRGEQVIAVSVTHEDPALAQAAVNAVLDAYTELYGERSGLTIGGRQRTLEERERELQRRLSNLRERLFALTGEFGPEALQARYETKIDELEELDTRLRDVELVIAERGTAEQTEATPQTPTETSSTEVGRDRASVEDLALTDSPLASLLDSEEQLEGELAALGDRFGPNHRAVRNLKRRLVSIRTRIDDRVEFLASLGPSLNSGSGDASSAAARSLEDLRALHDRYQQIRSSVNQEVTELSRQRVDIQSLQEEVAQTQQLLAETERRLEQIRVESSSTITGRVSIAARGERPLTPDSDKRLPAAVAGGGFAAGVGVGLVGLFGLLFPSHRYADDIEREHATRRLLGAVPSVRPLNEFDADMMEHGVYQIRNMLDLGGYLNAEGPGCIAAVTSAGPGEGKTSVAVTLGAALAEMGKRTLLVDADLTGRGLTARICGLAADTPVVGAPIEDQTDSPCATGLQDLLFVSARNLSATGECRDITRERLAPTLDRWRNEFDMVVIDTGPLLGSLSASVFCAAADVTVLTVARGQRPSRSRRALARLDELGANCAGIVFNRAKAGDWGSGSSSELRSSAAPVNGQSNGAASSRRRRLASLVVDSPQK